MPNADISKKLNAIAGKLNKNMNINFTPGIANEIRSVSRDIKSLEEENIMLKAKLQELSASSSGISSS